MFGLLYAVVIDCDNRCLYNELDKYLYYTSTIILKFQD